MQNPNDTSGTTEAIRFHSGGFLLSGVLHMPSAKSPPLVIGSHGLLADGNSEKQIALAEDLSKLGVAYFRFHHRGSGDSEGKLADTSLTTRVEDIVSAWKLFSEREDIGRPFGLFGSSIGAASCIAAWSTIRPAAIFVVALPIKGSVLLTHNPATAIAISEASGLPESFFRVNLDYDLTERIPAIRNIFIVHGTDDQVVPVADGHTCYELAAEPKRFIALEGGDHRVTNPAHQKILLKKAVEFFEEKLTLKPHTCGL